MKDTVASCPFCGGNSFTFSTEEVRHLNSAVTWHHLRCDGGGCCGHMAYPSKDGLIAAWNCRCGAPESDRRAAATKAFYECEGNNEACLKAAFDTYEAGALSSPVQVKAPAPVDETLQARVQPWMMACFGREISADRVERGDRLLEEVFELLQSGGYDPARVLALRDYVWGREAGEPYQEVGGVMITLAAYCLAHDLNMHEAGETELARIWTKVDKIRAKQAAKPVGSALPVSLSPSGEAEPLETALADFSRKLAASQTPVEDEFLEALYSNRSEMYRNFDAAPVAPQALTEGVAGLIREYENIVNTGAEYAASELRLAPTSTFEIYIGHFRDIGKDIATALASLAAERDSWRRVAERLETEKQSAERKLEEQRKALEAGRILANVAYNICQLSGLSDGHRASLKEAQVAFDEALLSGARHLAGDSK